MIEYKRKIGRGCVFYQYSLSGVRRRLQERKGRDAESIEHTVKSRMTVINRWSAIILN